MKLKEFPTQNGDNTQIYYTKTLLIDITQVAGT